MILALILFIITYLLMMIFSTKREIIVIISSILFTLLGIINFKEAITAINYDALLIIIGTMGIVGFFIESKMPCLMADYLLTKVTDTKWAIVVLAMLAGIVSAFVDNVATVLMVAPIGLAICKKLNISPVNALIAISVSSNLQGAATLIGDTTSIILGSYANMNFVEFFFVEGKPSIFFAVELGAIVTIPVMLFLFRKYKTKIPKGEITKISDYITRVNIILFNPDDLKLIKDTPSTRRKMLNIEISGINSEYLQLLTNYNKILKQRNAYLKALSKKKKLETPFLNILTEQLVDVGLKIMWIREDFINNINSYISDIYYKITHKGSLKVLYKSEFKGKNKEEIMKMFKKNISREIFLGKTLFGIQHDDLEFKINEEVVKEFSSVGEQKNSIISFKLAEIKNIEIKLHKKPILILDDLFSELDREKINNILNLIDTDLQTFITTTEISNVDKKLLETSKIFHVIDGKVEEE